MAISGVCYSWKEEVMEAGHCFNTTLTITGNTHTNNTIDGLSSTAGISVGMSVSDGVVSIPANCVVVGIPSATSVTIYPAATGTTSGDSLTFTADAFKILLIDASPVTTFGPTQTNVGTPGTGSSSVTNVGTDEVSGTGYTSGGFALTNVGPSLPGTPTGVATVSFSPNPSWTGATFSTTAAIIYNTTTRMGAAATPLNGRTVAVYDFGGTQTVSSGTLTLVMPTNNGTNAILRVA